MHKLIKTKNTIFIYIIPIKIYQMELKCLILSINKRTLFNAQSIFKVQFILLYSEVFRNLVVILIDILNLTDQQEPQYQNIIYDILDR